MELSLACILQRTHASANGDGLVDLNIRRTILVGSHASRLDDGDPPIGFGLEQ
jgi:hypothetical protein